MSVESLGIALNHSRATGTARLVLLGIANHDGDGGAWPSVRTLSKYAGGIDRRAVQRAIQKLEELGEIRRRQQAGGNSWTPDYKRPNLYIFTLECPIYCDHRSGHNDTRIPLVRLEAEDSDRAVEEPPGGRGTAGRAVEEPPKPSLNQPSTSINQETISSLTRATVEDINFEPQWLHGEHSFDPESGFCTECALNADEIQKRLVTQKREAVNA